ncbi:sugar kinase [Blautia faecis]|uniref:sugar kinase n=1 Tax=Blautia faecis TaxID=871665 RepID=UPI0021094B1B|nr:sugar kinase [Blautia faecis]
MSRVVTFGEIMMRLNPDGYMELLQAPSLNISFAGGEANAAVSIANFGMDVDFVTKLPENVLGKRAAMELRKYGVEVNKIVYGGPRLGTYFVEKGVSQRPVKVLYDRQNSSISLAKRSDFDWEKILEGASWFHFTGITPALGGECVEICKDALKVCKKKNITVCCDINYREKLWTKEAAGKVMTELLKYVDVCLINEGQAKDVLGIHGKYEDEGTEEHRKENCRSVAEQVADRFGCKIVAATLRTSISATENLFNIYFGGFVSKRSKDVCKWAIPAFFERINSNDISNFTVWTKQIDISKIIYF